jgi:PAS domain S-box-containing protein
MLGPQGEIVTWNSGAERIKGYGAHEIIGKNFSCFFCPEEIGRGTPERLLRIAAANGRYEDEGMRVRKDGSQFLTSSILTALRDPAGELQGFSEICRDVSETKEAEAKYRGLLEAAPDAMVVVNQTGEIVLLNVQAEKQFGYRRDELIGQKVTNIIPIGFAERLIADDLRSAEEALAQQIGTGIELTALRKDGSEFPIEIMLSPLKSDDGMLVTAAIRDISVRKEAEHAMQMSEERYRLLVDGVKDYAILMLDPKGFVVSWNEGAERIKGYKASEIIGKHFSCFYPPEALAAGKPAAELVQAATAGKCEDEGWRIRQDKSRFWADVLITPLRDEKGDLCGFSKITRDISVRKAEEQHLAQMEGRYRGLLEAAPDAMVVVNQTGEIVLLNVQAEKQFGYPRDELIGQKLTNIIPIGFAERLIADDLRSAEEPLAQQIGTGIELTALRKDGSEFPIEIMLSPLKSDEGILVTAAIRDISVRNRQTARVKRLKDEFIATVSHELRTPLTSIAGALAVLNTDRTGKLPETASRFITIAYNNSQRLVRLINDILDIEKIESGKVNLVRETVDVRSVLEQAMEDTRAYAKSYGVRIRIASSTTLCELQSDADWLVQIVTNLLSNAIKFSPQGGEVEIAVEKRNSATRISVRDHGCGIPEDFKHEIFEKFAQADSSDTRQKGGTGLGLSIVKQMVSRLGGEVGFDDAPGGGSNFYVDFPDTAQAPTLRSATNTEQSAA